jgi:hypothetical protein
MADGDPWSMDRIACDYVSDNGGTYRFRALEAYQTQEGLGWTASTEPTQTSMPRGFKPRKILTWDAGNHANRRSIVVATNTAYVAVVPGTTTFKVCNPATDVEDTFTCYGKEGERHRGVEAD